MVTAAIYGCAGLALTAEEKSFFRAQAPVGFILFARNCDSPEQVSALVAELKSLAGHSRPLILIDQEGGRVARLKPPHWRKSPPAGLLASLSQKDVRNARQAIYLNARLIAHELSQLGINVNCAPVADILIEGAHDIVGDRAYGIDPKQVGMLAGEMARGLLEGGVLPVIKHIPGHGRANADSHEALPVVTVSHEALRQTDFVPFKALAHLPLAMTAHVLYTALDKERMATVSPTVIKLIRDEIGFRGLLMSDDLSMHAMQGDFAQRTRDTLDAGCDIVLHCNGKMDEMQAIASAIRPLSEAGERRLAQAWSGLRSPEQFDVADAERELQAKLSAVA